jgi:membrane-associated phospholipid phosphatase
LITMRDGIVGSWNPPDNEPDHHDVEDAANMEHWEPGVRAAVVDFEMLSRLGFSVWPTGVPTSTISIWHAFAAEPEAVTDPPTVVYKPLVRFNRPSEAAFETQLNFLASYADLRPDRASEILMQLATPVPFLASVAFLRPDTKRWTLELLDAVFRLCQFVEFRVKHALACRRPNEYSPQVQPIIQTPGHGALPSGHATESFALALVLWQLLKASENEPYQDPSYGVQFMRLAHRITVNRTVAGVHFPIDSVAGALLGLTLGDYFMARANNNTVQRTYSAAHFDGTHDATVGGMDFLWTNILDVTPHPAPPAVNFGAGANDVIKNFPDGTANNTINLDADVHSSVLQRLWDNALAEWN